MIKTLLLSATAVLIFTGCFGGSSPKEWTSYIYPDKTNTKRSMSNGIFPTLEECQEASKKRLITLNLESRGDYRCGLNCNYHEGMKSQICTKMSK